MGHSFGAGGRREAAPPESAALMDLNLIQVAEAFGVPENVVGDWVRRDRLPHVQDGGRLLFDREQVASWAAARGLARRAGLLVRGGSGLAGGLRLEPLLRAGGVWRDVAATEVTAVFARVLSALPGATAAVRELLVERVWRGAVTFAPVGGGFALPHFTARLALGRESAVVALLLLSEAACSSEPRPDLVPVTRLLFFVAPSPRTHLRLLDQLCRKIERGRFREAVLAGAEDERIFRAARAQDEAAPAAEPREAVL